MEKITLTTIIDKMTQMGFNKEPDGLLAQLIDFRDEDQIYEEEFEEPDSMKELWEALHEYANTKRPKVIQNEYMPDHIYRFVRAAEMICNAKDILKIPAIDCFRSKYPNLYTTFEIWAWS